MLKRAIFEGIKNITRSFWLSATAISVLTVSLASVVLVATVSTTIGFAVKNLDNLISIPVILKDSVAEDKIPGIQDELNKLGSVRKTEYYDRNKSKEDLQKGGAGFNSEFIKSVANTDENLLPRFILVSPKNSENFATVLKDLKKDEYKDNWDRVVGDEAFVNNLIAFNQWTNIIGGVLILIFAAISILVMSNILRITIYSHRDEIEIMRLVGATNNYIRAPFVAEGVYYNLVAAVLVTIVFVPSFNFILPKIQQFIGADLGNNSSLALQTYLIYIFTIILGIAVGVATTYTATRRYLKL